MWNARRCAPFGADAGQALQLFDERIEDRRADRDRIDQIHMPGIFMPGAQHAAHLLRHLLVRLAVRVVDRRDDQILQHLDVFLRDDLGIDLQATAPAWRR